MGESEPVAELGVDAENPTGATPVRARGMHVAYRWEFREKLRSAGAPVS